jgi:hypothetical protein
VFAVHAYHSFSTEQINRTLAARLPTASPRETKRKLTGDAQNCAETAQNCKRLRSRFLWDFSPEFRLRLTHTVNDECAYRQRKTTIKSRLRTVRRSKISSFDPPLTAVFASYPTHPLLALFHPPIQLTTRRPRRPLNLDGWVDYTAISFRKLL